MGEIQGSEYLTGNTKEPLYRPTGQKELDLVEATRWKRWPPQLPEQPIFYPVTNEAYAIEIAQKWNTKDGGIGYVTRFQVCASFLSRYDVQQVGGKQHTEYWIPAEDLEMLNDNIVGTIEVLHRFQGE